MTKATRTTWHFSALGRRAALYPGHLRHCFRLFADFRASSLAAPTFELAYNPSPSSSLFLNFSIHHKDTMKWFIGSTSSSSKAGAEAAFAEQALPPDHPPVASSSAAKCPIDHASLPPSALAAHKPKASADKGDAAQCPIDHSAMKGTMNALGAAVGAPGALNPVNNIPAGLSATEKAPGQSVELSTERTMSSIPRPKTEEDAYGGGNESVWAYPSPQQFYVSWLVGLEVGEAREWRVE